MPRSWPGPPPLTEAEPYLPPPDPDREAGVREAMARIAVVPDEFEPDELRAFDHVDALETVSVLGEMVVDDDGDPGIVTAAYVLTSSVYPMVSELLALQIAFGSGPVQRDLHDLARLADRAARRGLTLDDYIAELRENDAIPDAPAARLLRGESRREPDAERIRRGIRTLRHIAALGDATEQAGIFCCLGWLHWALGQRALAQSWLSAAITRWPDHAVAWGLLVMIGAGRPEWLRRGVTPPRRAAKMGR